MDCIYLDTKVKASDRRRYYTLGGSIGKVLLLRSAGERAFTVDARYVNERVAPLAKNADLTKFIL
jgi:ATP-dependent protease HslVU (ClpYQ) ATPase subunit